MKKLFIITLAALTLAGCSDKKVEVYTVTYNSNGGTAVPKQTVEAGGTATAPENPSKQDYVFLFWGLENTATAYNFQTPVNANITLNANWQEESKVEYWQVSWQLNDGAWAAGYTPPAQVVKGGTLAEPTPPTKAGNTLEGWYKEAALTNKVAFPYNVSSLTADFTLYAKWKTDEEPPVNAGIIMVVSGSNYYFSLKADGSLHARGRNYSGQLGTGNNTDLDILNPVATDVAEVYTKDSHTLIVKKDGSVLGVGDNEYGQLALGDKNDRSAFTTLPVNNVKTMAVAKGHSLLVKADGSLWAAGRAYFGQLGTGDNTDKTVFSATNLTSGVVNVAAGFSGFSLALKDDGSVWGAGEWGVSYELTTNSFVNLFSGAKAIAAGAVHSLVLTNDGKVYAYGINKHGQLGIGAALQSETFIQAIENSGAPLSNVTAIAAGYEHSLALKSDGTLWATGINNYGQLGTGDENDLNKFTQVATGVKLMSAGINHTVYLKNDGTIATFGKVNPYDVLLNGSGKIIIKVNDTGFYQYITQWRLYDRNETYITGSDENIVNGSSGHTINIRPGTYDMTFRVSNTTVSYDFPGLTVADNETVTITYEYVSGSYRWTTTRSK